MSLLGIDIGTTGCKAAAFSVDDGSLLATAYREYPTLRPRRDWAELDSREVLSKIKETVAEVTGHTAGDPITAMCISSMGEAMTPVSTDRKILGNSILMVDMRGAEYIDKLTEDIGQKAFYKINPNILGTNYSLPKLLWLRDNRPDVYNSTWKFLLWGDLVAFMFGCEAVTSHSLANRTLLYDIRKEDWSDELLKWAGIDRDKLPKCVPSGTVAGSVSDNVARELGLPKGVKVVVGGHDQSCNSLGAGIYEAGKAVCGIGTVECITPAYSPMPEPLSMLEAGLNIEHHILPGLYVSFIYNQSGALLRWFRDTFAAADKRLIGKDDDIYDLLAREMPDEPTHLLVLPHFEMTGTPGLIADSAGVIAGLKIATTRGEIFKAMGIDTSEFVATGGGAKSDAWLQIKADIFGVPFVRPSFTECGVLGAAILAGVSTGVLSSPHEGVSRFVRREQVFEPNGDRHKGYRDLYEKYCELYPSVKHLQARL